VTPSNNLWRSFGFAGQGLWATLITQRNFRIHVAAATLVGVLGFLMRISGIMWLILILTSVLVLALELVNSAIEAVVDLVSPDYHPLAKVAKDAAAGAVLVAAAGALGIGILVFGPRLSRLGTDFMLRWSQDAGLLVIVLLAAAVLWGLVLALPFWVAHRRRIKPLR